MHAAADQRDLVVRNHILEVDDVPEKARDRDVVPVVGVREVDLVDVNRLELREAEPRRAKRDRDEVRVDGSRPGVVGVDVEPDVSEAEDVLRDPRGDDYLVQLISEHIARGGPAAELLARDEVQVEVELGDEIHVPVCVHGRMDGVPLEVDLVRYRVHVGAKEHCRVLQIT